MLNIQNYKSCYSGVSMNITIEKRCNILVGKNGSGKTTLLDYISGLKKEKEIIVTGNEKLVYMNQSMFFFERLKVSEFVKFLYSLDGIKRYKQSLEAFNETCDNRFHLEKIWNRQIGMLSGGERKLLYFLLIMSLDKSWYLLDEPFAGVDQEGQKLMCEVINNRNSEHRGMIIVLHEMEILHQLDEYHVIDLNFG